MRIVLFRHGPAGKRDPERHPDDRARPLTPAGEQKTLAAAHGVARLEPGLARILTSPLARAARTAELLAACAPEAPLARLDALAPGGSWRQTVAALAALDPEAHVALVGHEPDLGKLAGILVFGAPASLAIKKAGACAIEFDDGPVPGSGRLRWFLPPRLLRRLAGRGSRV